MSFLQNNCLEYNEVNDYVISFNTIDILTNELLYNDCNDVKYNQLDVIVDKIIDKLKISKKLLIKLVGLRFNNI